MVQVKFIKEKSLPDDGERLYIDCLWSDSAYTEDVKISEWKKELAPSYELWRFVFDPKNWDDFVKLYKEELQRPDQKNALREVVEKAKKRTVTLVSGNGDSTHNCALVLRDALQEMQNHKT